MTVNELIQRLTAFRDQAPSNPKAEVMLEFDNMVALEFATAELAVCTHESGTHLARFLIFRPNQRGKRVNLRQGMMVQ